MSRAFARGLPVSGSASAPSGSACAAPACSPRPRSAPCPFAPRSAASRGERRGTGRGRSAAVGDKDARATFNFRQDVDGNFATTRQYEVDPDSFFLADQELDCAVVALEGEPGAEWGTLALPTLKVKVEQGDDVFIIQHPRGGPKQIVMANNEINYIDDTFVQYSTDTLRGSSGSPVLDWQWRLVAIHHASGKLRGGSSPSKRYANEGILLHAIERKLGIKKLV